MSLGQHHLHIRKRVYKNLEPYPHTDRLKTIIDNLAYLVVFMVIIMTVPQVLKIWTSKDASGLSLLTWLSLVGSNVFWLVYGLLHHEKVIIVANGVTFFLNILVVAGIVVYGFP